MKLLAIDTASERCSVALSVGEELRNRGRQSSREHAALLLPWVQELIDEAGIQLQDLDAIIFGRGPGSFTSLRIGIGVVQGLAWGADIPVVPISSLQCAAQLAAGKGVDKVIVALDARMGEVFCGRFVLNHSGIMQAEGDEQVCAPEIAAALAQKGWIGVGNGFERYAALQEVSSKLDSTLTGTWPDATALIPLALDWLASNKPLPAALAQPVYLRDKVAEKPAPR